MSIPLTGDPLTGEKSREDALLARVAELESRVAFQEDTLQSLDRELAHQQAVIEQQQRMMQAVYRQVRDLRDLSPENGPIQEMQEKPPHY